MVKFRWFRFSLRSLFVVLTGLCVFLGYQYEWVRRRRAFLADETKQDKSVVREMSVGRQKLPDQPFFFWLFNERRVHTLAILVNPKSVEWKSSYGIIENDNAEYKRAKALFPESDIYTYAVRDGVITIVTFRVNNPVPVTIGIESH